MIESESQIEQQFALQDTGGDIGMADRAEQNAVELAELIEPVLGQGFTGLEVTIAAPIEVGNIQVEFLDFGYFLKDFDPFGCHLGAGSVATNHCNLHILHRISNVGIQKTSLDSIRKLSRLRVARPTGCDPRFPLPRVAQRTTSLVLRDYLLAIAKWIKLEAKGRCLVAALQLFFCCGLAGKGKTVGGVIGALIGALLGVAAHIGLSGIDGLGEMSWFVIVTGLLTGMGARWMGSPGGGLGRAAAAMVIALAAILATPYAKAMLLATEPDEGEAIQVALPNEEGVEQEAPAGEAVAVEEKRTVARPQLGEGRAPAAMLGPKQFDPLEYAYMAVAALLAYGLARGPEPRQPIASEEETPRTPAEPTQPESSETQPTA